jgi:hypothetical protein
VSGGEWLIRQRGPGSVRQGVNVEPFITERITIETTASGTEPSVSDNCDRLMFTYIDGRIVAFSWNQIVRAEYRPHPEP